MKLMLGGTPVKKMMVHNDTMDATMVASDLQAGVTGYANGQKITGTGKSFEFATYGRQRSNSIIPIPMSINIIEIACTDYPVQLSVSLGDMKNMDFSREQILGNIIIDGSTYPITVKVESNLLTLTCSKTIWIQIFYGKDNYV